MTTTDKEKITVDMEEQEYQDWLTCQDVPENQVKGEMFDDLLDMYRNEY